MTTPDPANPVTQWAIALADVGEIRGLLGARRLILNYRQACNDSLEREWNDTDHGGRLACDYLLETIPEPVTPADAQTIPCECGGIHCLGRCVPGEETA